MPVSTAEVRVIEMLATNADRLRRGIEEARASRLLIGGHVDRADGCAELIEHVYPVVRCVDHDPRRPFADLNGARYCACARRIDGDHIVRSHASDVGLAAVGLP